jgi:hypothetical protein
VAPIAIRERRGFRRWNMKFAILFLALTSNAFGQLADSAKTTSDRLRIELPTSVSRVQMTDEIVVTVLFRSPEREIMISNALG